MSRNSYLNILTLIGLLLFCANVVAAENKPITGELTIGNWQNDDGTVVIPQMKLRYKLGIFFGEPTELYNFYYETNDAFTEITSINLTAQVVSAGIAQNAYVKINPMVESPKIWGWDITGSPNWSSMFFTATGEAIKASKAIDYFQNGFTLANLSVANMSAHSGVNDDEYEDFSDLMNNAYVINVGGSSPLDGRLPSTSDASYSGTFWDNRLSTTDYNNTWNNAVTSGIQHLRIKDTKRWSWKYGQYQHAVIELVFSEQLNVSTSNKTKAKDNSQLVEIVLHWKDWQTGRVQSQSYRRKVTSNQRLIVADRIRRPKREDGTMVRFNVSYEIHFIGDEQEILEPTEELAKLDELFQREQDKLYDTDKAMKNTEIASVRDDQQDYLKRLQEEEEARALAKKEAAERAEALRRYQQTDEYKKQERQRKLAASIKLKQEKAAKETSEAIARSKSLEINSEIKAEKSHEVIITKENKIREDLGNQYEISAPNLYISGDGWLHMRLKFRVHVYHPQNSIHDLFVKIDNSPYHKLPIESSWSDETRTTYLLDFNIDLKHDYCYKDIFCKLHQEYVVKPERQNSRDNPPLIHNIVFQLRTPNDTIEKTTVYLEKGAHYVDEIKRNVKLIYKHCPSLDEFTPGERCYFPIEYKEYNYFEEYR